MFEPHFYDEMMGFRPNRGCHQDLSMGMSDEFIAKAVNVSIELVRQWLGLASV